jgi:glycosyltransferase involved in cell wall biosynthesis
MKASERTVIIIPAYNEARNLSHLLPRLQARHPEKDILVIDDGSQDGTREVARQHRVKVLSHPFNLGYGAAVQTGYKYALAHRYSYVVQLDADGQHEPEDIPTLLQPVQERRCDLALGSRFLHAESYRPPLARKLGIAFFQWTTRLATGQRLTDPTSGFQAMNQRVLQVFTGRHFPHDYPDADVLLMLHYYGLRIEEIPVKMHPSSGASMHRGFWRPLFYMSKMCLSLMVTYSLKGHFGRRRPPNLQSN